MRTRFRPTALVLISSAMLLTACGSGVPKDVEQAIQVSGQGEVTVVPDQFRVGAISSRTGDDITAMKSDVDEEINAALHLAKKLKLKDRQITATGFTVQPEWQWQPEKKLIGHRVQRDISFTVQGVEDYAELLEGLSQIGFTQISNSTAELSDPSAARTEALQKAVADAKEKAQVLAKASGRKLGAAVLINQQGGASPMPRMVMQAAAEDSSYKQAQYAPGEITITEQVNIRFHLK